MIFESQLEKEAFKLICSLADEYTSNKGCNDLDEEQVKLFKNEAVKTNDNGKLVDRNIMFDFDITEWLKSQESKNLSFTDEELETYFRKQREAEEYINQIIRFKMAAQYPLQKGHCANCAEHEELKE